MTQETRVRCERSDRLVKADERRRSVENITRRHVGIAATGSRVTTDRAVRHAYGPREATARGGRKRRDVRARRGLGRISLQGVPGEGDLRAREGAKQVQGVRGLEHLRAREGAKPVQGVRGLEHLRAREAAKLLQGVRGRECEHGRQRRKCKECGGSQICEHGRRRSSARSAGARASASTGGSEAGARSAGARTSTGKECKGLSSICEHGRQRYVCKECGGSGISSTGICEHGRRKHGTATRKECRAEHGRSEASAAPAAPTPPSTPSPRFWSSPRTWRTRARTTSASYPEGCTINHHLGPIDKHPRGSRVGGGVILRHLPLGMLAQRNASLRPPSASARSPRTNPSASPITSPPPHPRRIPRHTRRCPSQSSAAHASEQYHAAPHRAQGANAVTFEGRFEGFWFFWSFPPSTESPESPTSPPPPPPPPPPVLFAILAGSSLRVLRRAPAPRTLTAGAAKSDGRAFAFAFFFPAPLSSRLIMFENALAPHVSHAATPRVVGTRWAPVGTRSAAARWRETALARAAAVRPGRSRTRAVSDAPAREGGRSEEEGGFVCFSCVVASAVLMPPALKTRCFASSFVASRNVGARRRRASARPARVPPRASSPLRGGSAPRARLARRHPLEVSPGDGRGARRAPSRAGRRGAADGNGRLLSGRRRRPLGRGAASGSGGRVARARRRRARRPRGSGRGGGGVARARAPRARRRARAARAPPRAPSLAGAPPPPGPISRADGAGTRRDP